jgi:hypothetical protein
VFEAARIKFTDMENTLVSTTPKHRKGVSHHLPSRTRYRLPKGRRSAETSRRIVDRVSKVMGVKSVDVNHRTGSVFVVHEEHPEILHGLCAAFDSIADDLFEEVMEEEAEAIPGFSIVAHLLKKRAGSLDDFLAKKTNNMLDLKMLVPLLLLGAGLYKVSKTKAWMQEIPAWVLFYYAYDSYLKFHPPEVRTGVRTSDSASRAPKRLGVRSQ